MIGVHWGLFLLRPNCSDAPVCQHSSAGGSDGSAGRSCSGELGGGAWVARGGAGVGAGGRARGTRPKHAGYRQSPDGARDCAGSGGTFARAPRTARRRPARTGRPLCGSGRGMGCSQYCGRTYGRAHGRAGGWAGGGRGCVRGGSTGQGGVARPGLRQLGGAPSHLVQAVGKLAALAVAAVPPLLGVGAGDALVRRGRARGLAALPGGARAGGGVRARRPGGWWAGPAAAFAAPASARATCGPRSSMQRAPTCGPRGTSPSRAARAAARDDLRRGAAG